MSITKKDFASRIMKPWNYYRFMFYRLPSILWWGIRISFIDRERCELFLRFSWRNQNPFKSVYFGALSGAAELSTGALCMSEVSKRGNWSMLVTRFEGEFFKKAVGKIIFTCTDGLMLHESLNAIHQSESKSGTVTMTSTATNENMEVVAKFNVFWSFKSREK